MPIVVFNPYPGNIEGDDEARLHLVASAQKLKDMSGLINLEPREGDAGDSLTGWTLVPADTGARLNIASFVLGLGGKDRALGLWYLTFFSSGKALKIEELSEYEAALLEDMELPAPLIEFAARHGGVASTVSDQACWNTDYYRFIGAPHVALNVCSETDSKLIEDWVSEWRRNNLEFSARLSAQFGVRYCPGALNSLPCQEYHDGIYRAFEGVARRGFECDGDLLKSVTVNRKTFGELRALGDGARVFLKMKDGVPNVGGFYVKAEAIDQNKSMKRAVKRFEDDGVL